MYIYGNEINIGELLKDKIADLEEAQQAILAHQTNLIGSNVVVRQPNIKNVSIGIKNLKFIEGKRKMNLKQANKTTPKKNTTVDFGLLNINLNAIENSPDQNNEENVAETTSRNDIKQDNSLTQRFKVVVPNFGTWSSLFSKHFNILKEIKSNIEKFKNVYEEQRDTENSWKCLEGVLKVLDTALEFLSFPIQP